MSTSLYVKALGYSETDLFWPTKINKSENPCIWGSWLSFISIIQGNSFVSFVHLGQSLLHKRYFTFPIFVKWVLVDHWMKLPHTKQLAQILAHSEAGGIKAALGAGWQDAEWAEAFTDFPAKCQIDSVSLTESRMREQGERVAPASLSSPSLTHSLWCVPEPDKGKATGAWRFTEAAPLGMASPGSTLFASVSLREWDPFEHVFCFTPSRGAVSLPVTIYSCKTINDQVILWLVSILAASNRTKGKAQITSFPPSPPITRLHFSPCPCGRDWPLNLHSTIF